LTAEIVRGVVVLYDAATEKKGGHLKATGNGPRACQG